VCKMAKKQKKDDNYKLKVEEDLQKALNDEAKLKDQLLMVKGVVAYLRAEYQKINEEKPKKEDTT